MDRRGFMITGSGVVLSWSLLPSLSGCTRKAERIAGMTPGQWRLLQAVQAHLFPTEAGAPGAAEIRAAVYLGLVLQVPGHDPEEAVFIREGLESLEALVRREYGRPFTGLDEGGREAVLREFEAGEGAHWLHRILEYLLEALLTDPVYGGNPQGIGWRWLDHRPGFPRPPAAKRYYLL